MLDSGSIKDLESVRAAGVTIVSGICKAGVFEYPAPTVDELGEITPECLRKIFCQQLKTDYLNRANSPKSMLKVKKEQSEALRADDSLTDAEKVTRMYNLIQTGR